MTTTIVSQSNSESIINYAQVRLTTDAAAAAAFTLPLGFLPRKVRIVNLTDRIQQEWFEGMAALSSLDTAAVGTVTLNTTTGITVNPTANDGSGNSVTFSSATMVASKVYAVEAIA